MQIDIELERPISFNQAAAYLPFGYRPSLSTWWRWSRHGIGGIILETLKIGGKRYTTAGAIQRWVSALSAATNGEPSRHRTPAQRQREHDRAAAELAADGI